MDHEKREMDGIGNGCSLDVHKVFHSPELFDIAEVELDLEAQVIIVQQALPGQSQIAAKEDDMRPGLGA